MAHSCVLFCFHAPQVVFDTFRIVTKIKPDAPDPASPAPIDYNPFGCKRAYSRRVLTADGHASLPRTDTRPYRGQTRVRSDALAWRRGGRCVHAVALARHWPESAVAPRADRPMALDRCLQSSRAPKSTESHARHWPGAERSAMALRWHPNCTRGTRRCRSSSACSMPGRHPWLERGLGRRRRRAGVSALFVLCRYDSPASGYEPQRFALCGTSCCRAKARRCLPLPPALTSRLGTRVGVLASGYSYPDHPCSCYADHAGPPWR